MLSCFSCVQLCATLWTVTRQAPPSMGFSRQEYWSGLPCPPLGDLPNPGIKPASLTSPVLAGRFFTTSTIWEAQINYTPIKIIKKRQRCICGYTFLGTIFKDILKSWFCHFPSESQKTHTHFPFLCIFRFCLHMMKRTAKTINYPRSNQLHNHLASTGRPRIKYCWKFGAKDLHWIK